MSKKCISILVLLTITCCCLFASESILGIRFDYSLQKVDIKKTATGAERGFSDYGIGGGISVSHVFKSKLVVGAEICLNMYSYAKSGYDGTYYFTLDFMLKGGYKVYLNKLSITTSAIAVFDYRHFGEKKGSFPGVGLEALVSYALDDKFDLGLGTQFQMVFNKAKNDSYGGENNMAIRVYIALGVKV